jgi:hypothetical protein
MYKLILVYKRAFVGVSILYIYIYFFVCGSAAQRWLWRRITMFLDHTQRRATVGRTPLDE